MAVNMTETILVTGGSGFIGGWCIALLLQRSYSVRTTMRDLSQEAAVRASIAAADGPTDKLSFFRADLTRDDGWDAASAGCDRVLHVASPLGFSGPADPQAMLAAARDGTLRVLKAATLAGIKRVVMTSAAATATPPLLSAQSSLSDESVWFDPDEPKVDAYRQSKRLAERAAWDFINAHPGPTTLTTILPGAVFGPVLNAVHLGSVQVIARLLQGRVPAAPRLGFEVVDVRDIADAHIRAMSSPEAAGQRFLVVGDFMWMIDIARLLRDRLADEWGEAARRLPTRTMPDLLFRLVALRNPAIRSMAPRLGRAHRHSAVKVQQVLGWHARPAADTLLDCARSLRPLHLA